MAYAFQSQALVNEVASQTAGLKALGEITTSNLVTFAETLSTDKDLMSEFMTGLNNVLGRTITRIQEFEYQTRAIMKNEDEFGAVRRKIDFKSHEAVNNPSWDPNAKTNVFDVESQTEILNRMFYTTLNTWEFSDAIPAYQLYTSFSNAAEMDAFISGYYMNIQNAYNKSFSDLTNLACDVAIAGCLLSKTAAMKVNVLSLYNTAHNTNLTFPACLEDSDFLSFASEEIYQVIQNLNTPTAVYHEEDINRQTNKSNLVVEILSNFATKCRFRLYGPTFNVQFVQLGMAYEEVKFWQAPGTNFDVLSCSTVHISDKHYITNENSTGTVNQSGIIAFVHDKWAVSSLQTRMRSYSTFDTHRERIITERKADKAFAVDLTENAVVFYCA